MSLMVEFIDKSEFDGIVGHLRSRGADRMYDEVSWLATIDRKVLGLVIRDRYDGDFGWVLFLRHGATYETVDVDHNLPTAAAALGAVQARMRVRL
jgi:hypothetical protein